MFIKLKDFFLKQLWQRVYLLDGQLFQGAWVDGAVEFERTTDKPMYFLHILLVGRQHFFETHATIPVDNIFTASKLLKNWHWDVPFSGLSRTYLIKQGSQWLANNATIKLDDLTLGLSDRLVFILPVTWLLSSDYSYSRFSLNNKQIYKNKVSGQIHSIEVNNKDHPQQAEFLLNNWALQQGFNTQIPMFYSEPETYASISHGLTKLSLSIWWSSLYRKSSAKTSFLWRRAFNSVGLVGICYIALSSLFLLSYDIYLESRKVELSVSTQKALVHKQRYDRLVQQLDTTNELFAQQPENWLVWNVIIELLDTPGLRITRLNVSDMKVEMFGEAERASDILLALTNEHEVINARFINPIKNNNGTEIFGIAWELSSKKSELK